MLASIARPGGSVPELIVQVFASGTVAVICNEYGAPDRRAGVVDSGPIVSLASPGLTLMMNSSSDEHFEPQGYGHVKSVTVR